MKRTACCVFVLCCLACPTGAVPAVAETTARLEWPGSLSVRCGIPIGSAYLLLRAEARPAGSICFVAGLDSPVARIGPLAAAGLLREAGEPLGFGPGTSVSREATGLRFDGSSSGSESVSVQLTLVPEVLALFWLNPEGGPGVLGCTLGAGPGPITLDAVVSVSESGPDAPQTDWILGGPPTPAGRVLHGVSRIGVSLRGFSMTVSGGMSAAERAPSGWFALCTAAAGLGDSGIDLLAAGASRGYLGLGGGGAGGGLRAGARLRLAGPLGRIRARYVMTVGLPGFVPGPFLPSEEDLAFALERRWPAGDGAWETALELSNRIESGPDGAMADDPSGSVSVGWDSARLQVGLTVGIDRDEGAAAEVSADATGSGGKSGAGVQVRCAWSGHGPASLSVSGEVRFTGSCGGLLLRAGVRSVRLVSGGVGGCDPWGSVEWRVTDLPVNPSKGSAP